MSIYRGKTRQEIYLASLLYDSIDDNNFSAVKTLLYEKCANPNIIVPTKGISSFHLVIGSDNADFAINVTRLILQCGGDPNVRSEDGLTPVHIAAAWGRTEILHILMCCGGDSQLRDSNWMTPIHYARKENFLDCVYLLRSYLPSNYDIFHKEIEDCYEFKFDKILVNNGYVTGEYQITNNLNNGNDIITTENSITYTKRQLIDLANLPKSDNTKLVLNWFDTHIDNKGSKTYIKHADSTSENDDFLSYESSVDESDNENIRKLIDINNLVFRKVYKKKRKISITKFVNPKQETRSRTSKSSLGSSASDLSELKTPLTPSSIRSATIELKVPKIEDLSDESGIVTLPPSKNSFSSTKLSIFQPKLHDTSSDYMTSSATSLLNRNIFTIANDLSRSLFTSDESCIDNSKVGCENKTDDEGSTEMSFVTVSEVYKYEDKEEGIVLYEKRVVKVGSECNGSIKTGSLSSKMSSLPESLDYDPDTLRRELTLLGYDPGPITFTTKRVYLKKLYQLKKQNPVKVIEKGAEAYKRVYSPELEKTIRDTNWTSELTSYKKLEEALISQFSIVDPFRKWREGNNKSSFTYLLLDPRKTDNLPCRAELMDPKDAWETFLSAIFYVGKGKRTRPYSHLYEAVTQWKRSKLTDNTKKIQTILDIWQSGGGVICLHVFQNIIPVEAYTREAAMISALKLDNVSNMKNGEFYGAAATWGGKQKRMLGSYLLLKAMRIFLNEGERQLFPGDID